MTGPEREPIDDALALRRDVLEHGRLTVVGGGFIGCEAAASAVALGARLTLVEALSLPTHAELGHDHALVALEVGPRAG